MAFVPTPVMRLDRLTAIIAAIRRTGALTCAELSDEIDEEVGAVRKSLNFYARKGWIKRGPGRRGEKAHAPRLVQTWLVGDVPAPVAASMPAMRSTSSIERQAVLFVPAPRSDKGVVAQALARRIPIELAVQGWRCAV